jgi:hypothetical protein
MDHPRGGVHCPRSTGEFQAWSGTDTVSSSGALTYKSCSVRLHSKPSKLVVPAACQNGAKTTDIER